MPSLTLHPSPPPSTTPPPHPPISPITPPLLPASNPSPPDFSLLDHRPLLTHSPSPQRLIPPPRAAPSPIDLDTNPDALALRSAISILQLQRARATADMQALGRAKAAALADPGGFVADLVGGRVRGEGDLLVGGGEVSSSSNDDDDDDDEDVKEEDEDGVATTRKRQKGGDAPPWTKLPRPQTVVRCPPVNWAQYGVVGESLDKLHAEQVAAPTAGVPASLGPRGAFEFKAAAGDGQQREPPAKRLVGVAAPYAPGKDKIEKKRKGARQ